MKKFFSKQFAEFKKNNPEVFTRKHFFKRGIVFSTILFGMAASFPLQFWAPLQKDSLAFMLQSFGFGVMFAGNSVFMAETFFSWVDDIVSKSKNTNIKDKAVFLGVLLSFWYIWYVISTRGTENGILFNAAAITMTCLMASISAANKLKDPEILKSEVNGRSPELMRILSRSEKIIR